MASKKTTKKSKATTTPKKKGAAPKNAPTPKKGRGGPRGPRAGSKTSFILAQPAEMLAKDVVEAGAKAGHQFSDKYVWAVRSAAKSKGTSGAAVGGSSTSKAATPKKGPGRPRKAATSSNARTASAGLEDQLFALALEVGIARAEEIVARAREQINGLRL